MDRTFLALLLLAASCRGVPEGVGKPGVRPAPFEVVVDDPGDFDGRTIEIRSAYFWTGDVSVLTSGFAESYPPQPTQPHIWIDGGAPRGACLDRAQQTAWAEDVIAHGTFVYRADGGLGHLGAYHMALEDASLECA